MVVGPVDWTPDFSVGDDRLDADHKTMISIINRLIAAHSAGAASEALWGIFDELENYTRRHFAREEARLAKTQYPFLDGHKAEHERFSSQVSELAERYRANPDPDTATELIRLLYEWLLIHIKEHDQQYAPYLRK